MVKKKPGPKILGKKKKKKTYSFTLHREVYKKLREMAVQENCSASAWIEKSIITYDPYPYESKGCTFGPTNIVIPKV